MAILESRNPRAFFKDLEYENCRNPDLVIQMLETSLRRMGKDYGYLDETGIKSADEMRKETRERGADAFIRVARRHFEALKYLPSYAVLPKLKEAVNNASKLKGAVISYECLDPEGKKTMMEMKAEVDRRAAAPREPKPEVLERKCLRTGSRIFSDHFPVLAR